MNNNLLDRIAAWPDNYLQEFLRTLVEIDGLKNLYVGALHQAKKKPFTHRGLLSAESQRCERVLRDHVIALKGVVSVSVLNYPQRYKRGLDDVRSYDLEFVYENNFHRVTVKLHLFVTYKIELDEPLPAFYDKTLFQTIQAYRLLKPNIQFLTDRIKES